MTKLFVGNLNFKATQEELVALFSEYGAVETVSVITDRMTGQPRGFAFVEMTNRNEAEAAISALNGRDMHGRALNVNEARPMSESPRGGGGGGGRGKGGGNFDRNKRQRW